MELDSKQLIKKQLRDGLIAASPIIVGYLPIALAYGVLAKQAGLTLTELTGMSLFVYAGAAQFMGANMIGLGVSAAEIIVATFVLNFRHFIMSLSFINQIKDYSIKWKLPLAAALTDETFSVASIYNKQVDRQYGYYFYGTIMLTSYISWVLGSLAGGILGDVIPPVLSQSMGVALYAMFIGLLIPSIKKYRRIAVISIAAALINYIVSPLTGQGWGIVIGTVFGGLAGVFVLEEEKV
ncbi:4-azaleucine resistance probable transporter AzlC [Gracilibacillus ureilyticus]|uniref:4-azaleucine resistance probable transporter AzlC n=1 Tax=Gracilibacillus ureilyticus TaxID=531814 RepID=A0A1H9SJB6_9BACI|nr:AzlC family ABC transporter permease [Gracilibacillus ureilyticus]SER84339.1 4-azaleucine resistance probable transporter AzlC [Gracilibacillus ureilyticus]